MRENAPDTHGHWVDRGPRRETTLDMTSSRLKRLDPGAATRRRRLTREERAWLRKMMLRYKEDQ